MAKFKVGDKVEYVGPIADFKGMRGVVDTAGGVRLVVKMEDGSMHVATEDKFKVANSRVCNSTNPIVRKAMNAQYEYHTYLVPVLRKGKKDYVTIQRVASEETAKKLVDAPSFRIIGVTVDESRPVKVANARFSVGDWVIGKFDSSPRKVTRVDGSTLYWQDSAGREQTFSSTWGLQKCDEKGNVVNAVPNAVVQKALNATGDKSKQKDWNVSRGTKGVYSAVRFHMPFDMNTWGPWYRGDFKPDRGQADTDRVRHFYDEASRERFIRDENRKNGFVVKGGEYVLPGYVPKTSWNADTSVLRETAVNSARSTNAVVAKALNTRRVARNARQVEMPKIPQGAKGRRDLEKVVKRINEAYKMDGARQSSELTSIKNELVWDTAYYTSGLSGADKAEMMKAIRFLMSKCKVRAVKPKGFTTSEMYD